MEDSYKDAHWRSVMKALSWRIIATVTTILIVFAFTRKLVLSLGVGAVEIVTKMLFYYFHERTWEHISFGKKRHPLSSLPIKGTVKKEDMELIENKLRELGYMD